MRNLLALIVRDLFLPWLLYENQLACLKVQLKACDKPPIQKAATGTDFGGGPGCVPDDQADISSYLVAEACADRVEVSVIIIQYTG
mgnify:CR=1 FL=1